MVGIFRFKFSVLSVGRCCVSRGCSFCVMFGDDFLGVVDSSVLSTAGGCPGGFKAKSTRSIVSTLCGADKCGC